MLSKIKFLSTVSILMLLISCENGKKGDLNGRISTHSSKLKYVEAFPKLSFERPVDFQISNIDADNLFVVEQQGIIWVFDNDTTTTDKSSFLDIQSKVDNKSNEEGLLGLAFHPNYKSNGYFYVNYTTDKSTTVISRFQASSTNANEALSTSEEILIEFDQPHGNHNGGQITFGPDGYLYIAIGDGGSGGDPHAHGQNLETVLGTILRIDVDNKSDGKKYSIPTDNPFIEHPTAKKEIYAYGLRNPWRMSFDELEGTLWVGDVGQNKYEEIDIIEKGGNYGWNTMEGLHCFKADECDKTDLILPVKEYDHDKGDISITGGFVYRGSRIKELQGSYVYGDFGSGRIWALNTIDYSQKLLFDTDIHISSFGVDHQNELYFCGFDGKIFKFIN